MANYVSGAVYSAFGSRRVMFGNLVCDDGAGTVDGCGFDNIDFVTVCNKTAAIYIPPYTLSGGTITIVSCAAGSSFNVMIVGR